MSHGRFSRWSVAAAVAIVAGLLASPPRAAAQTVVGRASVARATTIGLLGGATTRVLADTGSLAAVGDARDASMATGSVPSLLTGEVLDAITISWADQVVAQASTVNPRMTIGGVGVSADFVMSRASAALGKAGEGQSIIDNLSIGGVPIVVTGEPNQTIWLPLGRVIINEQTVSGAGATTVNALHAIVPGVADVILASATAGVQ